MAKIYSIEVILDEYDPETGVWEEFKSDTLYDGDSLLDALEMYDEAIGLDH